MIGRSLILIPLLVLLLGVGPTKPEVRCFGILLFNPDGTKQSAVLFSDGKLDRAYLSQKNTHYSDGYLITEKTDLDKVFDLAAEVYQSSTSPETALLNYDALVLSKDEKHKVLVFIETDNKARSFVRKFDEKFDSADLKKLDEFLQTLLEK